MYIYIDVTIMKKKIEKKIGRAAQVTISSVTYSQAGDSVHNCHYQPEQFTYLNSAISREEESASPRGNQIRMIDTVRIGIKTLDGKSRGVAMWHFSCCIFTTAGNSLAL